MESLDDLDRRIIAVLQQDGRASWAHVARLCGASIPTVSRRTRNLIDHGVIAIGIIPELGHAGPTEQFFTSIRCRAGYQAKTVFAIAARADVRFAALVTGDSDVVAELVLPHSPRAQTRAILDIAGMEGIVKVESDLIPCTHKSAHDWSRSLLDPSESYKRPRSPHQCNPSHFRGYGRALLGAMQDDARIGFRDLGHKVDLDGSTTRRKFMRLRERGCVTVVTLVSAAALGFEAEANLTIHVNPRKMTKVIKELCEHRSVRYVASMLNGSSLLCEVIAESGEELYSFTSSTLANLDGVTGWSASIELMTVKRGFLHTPWASSFAVEEGLLGVLTEP